MRCPECGAENSPYRNFCYQCAHPLTKSGQQVRAGIAGTKRPAPAMPPVAPRPSAPVIPPPAAAPSAPVTPSLDAPQASAGPSAPVTPSLDATQPPPTAATPVTPPLDASPSWAAAPASAMQPLDVPQAPLEPVVPPVEQPVYPAPAADRPRPAAPSPWASPRTWTVIGLAVLTLLLLAAVAQLGLRAMARPEPPEVVGQTAARATAPAAAPTATQAQAAAAPTSAPPTVTPAQPTAVPTALPPVAAVAPTQPPAQPTGVPPTQAPAPTQRPVQPTAVPSTQSPPPAQAAPPVAVAPPGLKRQGETLAASYVSRPPTIDGALTDWTGDGLPVNHVVYAQGAYGGPDDLQAQAWLGWDDQALYVATRVRDDVLSQPSRGSSLYLGDSVEIQLDADLAGDFDSNEFDADDWHIGLSPGNFADQAPEAYVWTPRAMTGAAAGIRVAARPLAEGGYSLEAAIPWRLLGVKPADRQPFGFTFSVSDDDSPTPVQEAMLSTSASRQWHRPQTFNTLVLQR